MATKKASTNTAAKKSIAKKPPAKKSAAKKSSGRKYSPAVGKQVEREMHEMHRFVRSTSRG